MALAEDELEDGEPSVLTAGPPEPRVKTNTAAPNTTRLATTIPATSHLRLGLCSIETMRWKYGTLGMERASKEAA